MNKPDPPLAPLLDDVEVAAILRCSVETLASWRQTAKVKLPFIKVGGRLVRYRQSDVQALIDAGLQEAA